MKVHLVDGTFELFRAYYGAPAASAPDGREVGATRAFMRSMVSLLREAEVTHVAVAFDHVIESFRNDLFDGYKTGEGIEPALWSQFELAEGATRALGMVTWPMIEHEADDGLATGAARYSADSRVEQVVICSPDKDLSQCVRGDLVVTKDRMRGIVRDEAAIIEKFGVGPASIPDYLGLIGDSADGIPGIPKWGAKSTAAVLSHYEHIEAIPPHATAWDIKVRGADGLARNLRERREDALLYRKLAVLREDSPIAESLDDLEWKGAPRAECEEFCASIGENDTLGRIPRWR